MVVVTTAAAAAGGALVTSVACAAPSCVRFLGGALRRRRGEGGDGDGGPVAESSGEAQQKFATKRTVRFSQGPGGMLKSLKSLKSGVITKSLSLFDPGWSFHTALSEMSASGPSSIVVPTAEESAAVNELRARISGGATDGDGGGASAPHPRWLEEGELLRYVKARPGDVGEAEALLRRAIQWRGEHAAEWEADDSSTGSFGALHAAYLKVVEGREGSSTGDNECDLPDWWTFVHKWFHVDFYGADGSGTPILYNNVGGSDLHGLVREVGFPSVLRYVVFQNDYFLDKAREVSQTQAKVDQALGRTEQAAPIVHGGIVIVDVSGLSWQKMKAFGTFKEIAAVANFLHPERQRRCFIVRAPRMFSMMWKTISSALEPRAREKVTILGLGDSLEGLIAELGLEMVPTPLGGMYDELPKRAQEPIPVGAYEAHCRSREAARARAAAKH